jgi:hypothetical protein
MPLGLATLAAAAVGRAAPIPLLLLLPARLLVEEPAAEETLLLLVLLLGLPGLALLLLMVVAGGATDPARGATRTAPLLVAEAVGRPAAAAAGAGVAAPAAGGACLVGGASIAIRLSLLARPLLLPLDRLLLLELPLPPLLLLPPLGMESRASWPESAPVKLLLFKLTAEGDWTRSPKSPTRCTTADPSGVPAEEARLKVPEDAAKLLLLPPWRLV